MDWSSRSANAYWVLSQLPLCCPFTNAFEHVLGRHAKQEADNHILTACLIAWATNMGLGRMGEISDISFHTLVSASDNFIRPETSREANDRITPAILTSVLIKESFPTLWSPTTSRSMPTSSEQTSMKAITVRRERSWVVILHGYMYTPARLDSVRRMVSNEMPETDILVPDLPLGVFSVVNLNELVQSLVEKIDSCRMLDRWSLE
jgi:hypothetical protein